MREEHQKAKLAYGTLPRTACQRVGAAVLRAAVAASADQVEMEMEGAKPRTVGVWDEVLPLLGPDELVG